MTRSGRRTETRAVIDTNIFVPAIAGATQEAGCYAALVRKCWKVVSSAHIAEEYQRVIRKYGYSSDAVLMEFCKLEAMNKFRECEVGLDDVGEDLAPRKDRHIVAPCKAGHADVIITHDRGLHQRKGRIFEVTRARVLSLSEAQALLDAP